MIFVFLAGGVDPGAARSTLARGGPVAPAMAAVVAGVAFGVFFLSRQRRLASPLLDVRLFADRGLRGALTLAFVLAFTPTAA